MDAFLKNFSEVRKELFNLKIFKTIINGIILLLASLVSLQFFQLSWAYAVFPVLFYLTMRVTQKNQDKEIIGEVSQKYPLLEEKLKTAYDNRGRRNEIVERLLKEVSADMDKLSASRFLENRTIMTKITLGVALIFILLSLNFFHLNAYSLGLGHDPMSLLGKINSQTKDLLSLELTPEGKTESENWEKSELRAKEEEKKVGGGEAGGKIPGFSKGPLPDIGGGAGTKPDEDIFGEPSSAEIEGEEVKMEMHPEYGGEIEIREERMKKPEKEFTLEEAKGFRIPEKDPLKYEELIKRYFEKLLEEEEKK